MTLNFWGQQSLLITEERELLHRCKRQILSVHLLLPSG